ncbi:TonB-dependent receptor plug domain-containing protein [Sorangium sp. So ce861]|uniref:TonB-dependent receptor plug domain-containing protein n=1 Tax=Sorangium sp. So ce861 TaxID=3133323 RepID=UPI003F630269
MTHRAVPIRVAVGVAALVGGAASGAGAQPAGGPPSPAAATSLQGTDALAQMSLEELLNVQVVTASGGEAEDRSIAAANLVVIGKEEIRTRGWRSLAEVLANTPGLYVIEDLVLPSVGVRGVTGGLRAGSRIVKVMINGHSVIFQPDLTALLGPEYIPIECVERVEIAKGPLSALYGANAFLATVNVITRDARGGGSGAAVSARGNWISGQPGYGGTLLAQQATDGFGVLAAYSFDRADRSGLRIERTFPGQRPELPAYAPFFADESRGDIAAPSSFYAQLSVEAGALGSLKVQGGVQRLDSMGEFQLNSALTHASRHSLQNVWASVHHDKAWTPRLETQLSAGVSRGAPTREEELFLTGVRATSFRRNFASTTFQMGARVDASLSQAITVSGGADSIVDLADVLYYTEIYRADVGGHASGDEVDLVAGADLRAAMLSTSGAFAQIQVSRPPWLEGLHLSANVRLDKPNHWDAQASWRASAAYRWHDNLATKLIVGRSYQAPSAVLLYGLTGFGRSNNVIGSETLPSAPLLQPQKVRSAEVVVSGGLSMVLFEAAAYVQEIKDRIEFTSHGANFVGRNQGDEVHAGAELSLRLAHERIAPYVSVAANGRVAHAEQDGELVHEVDTELPLVPFVFALGGLDVRIPEAHVNINVHAKLVSARGAAQGNVLLNDSEPYALPSYATFDATISSVRADLLGDGSETAASVSVKNLLDQRRSEPGFGGFDVPVVGRSVAVNVTHAF